MVRIVKALPTETGSNEWAEPTEPRSQSSILPGTGFSRPPQSAAFSSFARRWTGDYSKRYERAAASGWNSYQPETSFVSTVPSALPSASLAVSLPGCGERKAMRVLP